MRISLLLTAFLALVAASARADLAFVQVVQGQTSRGADGLFGKTWVEVRGERMRIVSGYARRLQHYKETEAPRRLIQILDLPRGKRLLIFPEKKSYAEAPLAQIDYGNRIENALDRGAPDWRIVSQSVSIREEPDKRRLLGVEASHHRIVVRLLLEKAGGGRSKKRASARMEQHLWVAPVGGKLSRNLLDLLSFENKYRQVTGGALTPLDYERYQVREAAVYLRVPASELQPVVEKVRERSRDISGYPVASSVSWWRRAKSGVALGDVKPKLPGAKPVPTPVPDIRPHRPRPRRGGGVHKQPVRLPHFKVISWRVSEKRINKMYARTRKQVGGFAFGPIRKKVPLLRRRRRREPAIYPKFESELRKVLGMLVAQQDQMAAQQGHPSSGREAADDSTTPFYEIYTQMHGIEVPATVPEMDFRLPKGYQKIPYNSARNK